MMGFRIGCCSFPNGGITLALSLLILPALLFTFWGAFTCAYADFDAEKANNDMPADMTAIGLFWRQVPIFSTELKQAAGFQYNVLGACRPYNLFGENVIYYDRPFVAARGFGVLAVVSGCVMTVAIWVFAICIPMKQNAWRIIGLVLAGVGLCQFLTLLILASKVCSAGCANLKAGGILSVVAGVLWVVIGMLCFLVGEPKVVEEENHDTQVASIGSPDNTDEKAQSQLESEQTTTQQHVEEDGTIVIEKTTTRADGGVTVTKEVIPPGLGTSVELSA
mmetsp:Transcript_651/g.1589  ORF Transcript_651/g.1589 Transcript_651/m.1589 type:complete len:278 (-) Transcript_651:642-1475(-)